ncbi:MAG: hypothetical protein ACI4VR_01525 [Bacilli bacterium]
MNNFSNSLKRFFGNKNTVTIIGVLICILVLYVGYNYRIKQATTPVRVPYANQTIQPRTLITADMISYTEVLPSTLKGKYILNANLIINKYSNYNTIIPAGSMFYSDAVINERDLPDSAFGAIPQGYTVVSFPVTMASTYGNSMYPGNYINLYFKAINEDTKKLVFGKLISNIEILDVKDSSGNHVFENTSESRTPAYILFAVPEEQHVLIRKAMYLTRISAELIPVPNTATLTEEDTVVLDSQALAQFIIERTERYELEDINISNGDNNNADNNQE